MAAMTPLMMAQLAGTAVAAAKSMQDQKKASSASQRQYNLQMQQINAKQAADERKRQETLKKQKASQRARFAGLGIGAGGGSAEAVLEGLTKRSNADAKDQATLSDLSRENLNATKKTDLLSQKSKAFENNISLLIGKK